MKDTHLYPPPAQTPTPTVALRTRLGHRTLVLASRSPRRRDLLSRAGLPFVIDPPPDAEERAYGTTPRNACVAVAEVKARQVAPRHPNALVVAADTVVALENRIFGKPTDRKHAVDMLTALSGRSHQVFTGFTLLLPSEQRSLSAVEETEVTFRTLDPADIEAYADSGAPLDKAGGYGIQDTGALFVSRIVGCFYNVVGFPLARFYETCLEFLSCVPDTAAEKQF